ncbi:hypothetical protein C900_04713 [Fulvivirga imtechensis AK7]|uniref:Uncharacterized protein n=1 Tax=Fulvivirga imtechensis AK7 TaxID=1237149 RepID=L8JLD3_9BACT|nr:tetratricopeptide repeat protein [Fulvivirga imtechensis]ELR69736.1 hypothetical protein C900_04713 [Fulvivirga imtechensis AK7]
MGIRKYYIIFSIFCALISVVSFSDLSAQKVKSKDKVSESELREAEFYFIEGEKYYILEDYAKALALFQKSLEVAPGNATVHFKIATILIKGNEPYKALSHVLEALKLDGNNKYFYVLAADIYTQLGDFDKASEVYEEMIGKLDDTDHYLFELAAIYLYQQRYGDALVVYDKIEKAYGMAEEIITQKQKIYLQNNNLEKALAEGQRLINTYPEEEAYVLKQAEILISNDQNNEAAKYLEEFLKANPAATQSRLVLSELQRKSGEVEKAIKNLEVAFNDPALDVQNKVQLLAEYRVELSQEELKNFGLNLAEILVSTHPDVADAHIVYADLLQTIGEHRKAKDAYMRSLELDESNFTVWQNVLQLLIELNKMDSVALVSGEALELFPNQGALYYYNGAANLQQKNYKEAIAALEQGKRLSSANLGLVSAFNSMLGDAYNGTREYEKSDKAYEAALDFDPENYAVLNNYSYFLALRKANLEKAEKMSAKAVKDNPNNATFLDTYAWVLYMRQKYKEAKKVMEQAIATGEISAVHYEHYGDILYKLGDVDGAVKQWQVAKGLNPKSEVIDKKIADRKLYE